MFVEGGRRAALRPISINFNGAMNTPRVTV